MLALRSCFETNKWVRGAVLLTTLLILGAGFCLFDSEGAHHGHHDDTPRDLCCGMIVASLVIPLLAGPRVNGRVQPDAPGFAYVVSPHLPDPPPKRGSLS